VTDQSNTRYVQNPRTFWAYLRPWCKWAIVLIGLLIGVGLWWSVMMGVGPLFLLVFLGKTTVALIVKIIIGLLILVSIPIALVVIPWLFSFYVYVICNMIISATEANGLVDFIFKTSKEA
jgi:hypothetical protein